MSNSLSWNQQMRTGNVYFENNKYHIVMYFDSRGWYTLIDGGVYWYTSLNPSWML